MNEQTYISSILEWAEITIEAISVYDRAFDKRLLFKMTLDKEEIKSVYKSYRVFTSEIIRIRDGSGKIAAELSRALCAADSEKDSKKTARLLSILDAYMKWSNAFSSFISASDKLFAKKESEFKLSEAISLSNTLRSATENLKRYLHAE